MELAEPRESPPERALIVALEGGGFHKITSLAFDAQNIGTTSAPRIVYVRNTGSAPVTISEIKTTSEFGVTNYDGNCPVAPATLVPGTFCFLQITFTPSAAGPRSGALLFPNNANEPWADQQGLSLVGTGQ